MSKKYDDVPADYSDYDVGNDWNELKSFYFWLLVVFIFIGFVFVIIYLMINKGGFLL